MELTETKNDAGRNMDAITYCVCTVSINLKYLFIIANREKLAKNINDAIADWLSAKNNEKSYKIMKKYASTSRLCTFIMVYLCYIVGSLYILTVVVINVKEIFFEDRMNITDGINTRNRMFIIPCGELGNKMTELQYAIFTIVNTVQLLVICTTQSITDCFFINVTLHISGQLKVLKTKFKSFTSKPDTHINYRKQFINLVNRHCKLMEHNQNVEDTFHLCILFQFVSVTLLLALLGLRILLFFKNGDYIESIKTILFLNYMFIESLLFCYGGDFVQKGSEGIFRAMYMTSWVTFPVTLMKDLKFAIMRSSYPFRLTGGKFFYVNCQTMVYILKTAASYISVLRVALKD
ncbi:odorant receptor 42b [Monomorium pharaonis]|uniref:odorant receptor 42b n=1 Tax=Monomorium pharaonis TaxID=307658 RepID=UPI00063F828D|nr:odorant receptor 42b [Monomorium pharaonis]